ncbi:MAG: ABC transporter substrate-binding protein [Desulfofustis sp. PB-SRB1]|jgi:peptide/nickel transport system substrate-binding protein|nr:ABC transporter substrate-binding protein [Desulfofustis sp. PB-SRB1]MBM1002934.1 ABC transporter substrate-binding protein [Desulfofustis sp. PB-SRB1]HBH29925.1 ABC transporter substrate-binding protein [Desulfofustis sp.]HBH32481.1 ABC transporter substrate-binding protein [Desulfofustis sp.]
MKIRLISFAAAFAMTTLAPVMASAADLTVGLASEPSSIDPHYHNLGPNNEMRRHIFESLIWQDEQQKLTPLLATSWEPTSETTWEFKLRKGVKFHDGSDFTARDFVYTACRIPTVPNSPSSFTIYTSAMKKIETPDPHTLIIHTEKPYPLLPVELAVWGIISATANGVTGDITFNPDGTGCGITSFPQTKEFNSGQATIGTGMFKYGEYVKGDRYVMNRNDAYWGEGTEWDTVTFKPITNSAARVAALLAGDVDFISKPPTQDLERLESEPDITLSSMGSNRVIYLHMDQYGPSTPGVKGTGAPDGTYEGEGPCATSACEKNPLLDRRVRQALSKAINRDAIVDKVMGGYAVAAGELLPQGFFGTNEGAKPEAYDPEGAKKLLVEAGYPNGFELVLGTPNDRYINDAKIAQAIAQMFTRVGIKTSVNAMTKSVFFATRNKYEFSLYLAGWGSGTGEMSSPMRALVGTRDKSRGLGGTNRGRYSNPVIDDMIMEALSTVDDDKRATLLAESSRMAMEDYAILPLHFEVTIWAHRSDLSYGARADQYTMAIGINSKK